MPWAREAGDQLFAPPEAAPPKLEAAGFRVDRLAGYDPAKRWNPPWREPSARPGLLPPLGVHLLIGRDWDAIARNSARNLQEDRTRLFNAVLERPE